MMLPVQPSSVARNESSASSRDISQILPSNVEQSARVVNVRQDPVSPTLFRIALEVGGNRLEVMTNRPLAQGLSVLLSRDSNGEVVLRLPTPVANQARAAQTQALSQINTSSNQFIAMIAPESRAQAQQLLNQAQMTALVQPANVQTSNVQPTNQALIPAALLNRSAQLSANPAGIGNTQSNTPNQSVSGQSAVNTNAAASASTTSSAQGESGRITNQAATVANTGTAARLTGADAGGANASSTTITQTTASAAPNQNASASITATTNQINSTTTNQTGQTTQPASPITGINNPATSQLTNAPNNSATNTATNTATSAATSTAALNAEGPRAAPNSRSTSSQAANTPPSATPQASIQSGTSQQANLVPNASNLQGGTGNNLATANATPLNTSILPQPQNQTTNTNTTAQANAGASPTPPSTQTGIALARVVQSIDGNNKVPEFARATLNFGGQTLNIVTPRPLLAGQQIEVTRLNDMAVQVRILPQQAVKTMPAEVVEEMQALLRQVLPTQAPLADSLNQLRALNPGQSQDAVGQIVRSLMSLFSVSPQTQPQAQAQQVAQMMQQSGLFTENRMARQASGQPLNVEDLRTRLGQLRRASQDLPTQVREQLLSLIDRAEARSTHQQIQSARQWRDYPDGSADRYFRMDLPLQTAEGFKQVELELKEHRRPISPTETQTNWTLNLHFDLDPLGPIDARIHLEDEWEMSVAFWAESMRTADIIRDRLESFSEHLTQQGFKIDTINVRKGRAPNNLSPALSKHLVDVHT